VELWTVPTAVWSVSYWVSQQQKYPPITLLSNICDYCPVPNNPSIVLTLYMVYVRMFQCRHTYWTVVTEWTLAESLVSAFRYPVHEVLIAELWCLQVLLCLPITQCQCFSCLWMVAKHFVQIFLTGCISYDHQLLAQHSVCLFVCLSVCLFICLYCGTLRCR